MNRKLLGNILIVTLLILVLSGLLMYFKPFMKNVASMHTFFGLLFILAMIFHILNNKKPLSNYISVKKQSKLRRLQSPLIFFLAISIAMGLYFENSVLSELYQYGNKIRNEQLRKVQAITDYEIIPLENASGEYQVTIELKKGQAFQYPLFAIWVEDLKGNYIETLYISRVISSSSFDFGKQVDGNWKPDIVRRPEALPYWSHKRGVRAADGLFMPLNNGQDLDAVSGATPTGNFIINSKSDLKGLENFKILLEVNQSYDWNEFFTEHKFPEDPIYSGSGQVGQPSLIYESIVQSKDLNMKAYKFMNLVGHGHHSGKNGNLYTDLSKISTAKEIVDRLILSIE